MARYWLKSQQALYILDEIKGWVHSCFTQKINQTNKQTNMEKTQRNEQTNKQY
jgi:hypothetical protein